MNRKINKTVYSRRLFLWGAIMLDTLFMGHANADDADMFIDKQFVANEIRSFKSSRRFRDMANGENYYRGWHDILFRQRTAIGANGELEVVKNLPNNRIVDNQYKKMVDQKCNYLLGQPVSVQCDNAAYSKCLKELFNKSFQRTLKLVGEDALNCGVGWLFLYYDELGELAFKRFSPLECIPEWHDAEHTELDALIRVYDVIAYENNSRRVIHKVEIYAQRGISYFTLTDGGDLIPEAPYFQNYFVVDNVAYNWLKIPIIPFKYNAKEIPLITMVKSLQDGLNVIESDFQNIMQEDARNTIIILKNYDGENLGEFRRNLAQYGAVKVSSADGMNGDVTTLKIEANADNYKAILEVFKKAIIENAMGYDAKDDRLSGNPNQMNIQSMYSDIDLDANGMETEFQASFEKMLFFINSHLANIGAGDFSGEAVEIIFNRDILISEGEVIENCAKSVGLLSNETIIANHPWVDDPQKEMERVKAQQQEEMSAMQPYDESFHGDDNGENAE